MILHFLKRDFSTYKVFWLILFLCTILSVPFFLNENMRSNTFTLLLFAYFLFCVMPIMTIAGTTHRTQNVMSRNYLLSLPIHRKTLYLITLLRILVFCLPCMILSCGYYAFGDLFVHSFNPVIFASKIILVLCVFIWFANGAINGQLMIEKVSTYLTLGKRALSWIKFMIASTLELNFLMVIFIFTHTDSTTLKPFFICFPPLLALIAVRFYWTRKKWIHGA